MSVCAGQAACWAPAESDTEHDWSGWSTTGVRNRGAAGRCFFGCKASTFIVRINDVQTKSKRLETAESPVSSFLDSVLTCPALEGDNTTQEETPFEVLSMAVTPCDNGWVNASPFWDINLEIRAQLMKHESFSAESTLAEQELVDSWCC